MTDIPIIFSASMVQALLAGRKTMTRRLAWRLTKIKLTDEPSGQHASAVAECVSPWQKVQPGDRLWVRESIKRPDHLWRYAADDTKVMATGPRRGDAAIWSDAHKRDHAPSIHMPRWASRLTLVVTATKIERLQDISDADAAAEGIGSSPGKWTREIGGKIVETTKRPEIAFSWLWENLHGPGSWTANPEVIAITFTVHQQNVDAIPAAA